LAPFSDFIGENESINYDALVRKIRKTKESISKKRGHYITEFENNKFEIPVGTVQR
jgi:hypothetical protein